MFEVNLSSFNWLIKKANNDLLKKNLKLLSGRVLDLGCGVRPYEKDILKFADDYIGLDWFNTQHDLCADIVADLNNPLPLKSAIADSVVSFQVMEHLCEPQIMLNEAFRILKPGNMILIAVPFNWRVHEVPYDFFRYTCYGLKYMLKKAGFSEIVVQAVSGFWPMWCLKLNYQTTRLIRGPKYIRLVIRVLLMPFWFFNQIIGLVLDKFWPGEEETAGYFANAKRP